MIIGTLQPSKISNLLNHPVFNYLEVGGRGVSPLNKRSLVTALLPHQYSAWQKPMQSFNLCFLYRYTPSPGSGWRGEQICPS